MDRREKHDVIEKYNNWLERYGYDPQALGWPKKRQNLRFHVLLSQWKLEGKRVLDVGCGFGDLYGYCRENDLHVNYDGVDINPSLIEKGKTVFPEASLRVHDAISSGLTEDYDYIFSSGVHNFELRDNMSFIQQTFRVFNRHSREGFALNFLSDRVSYRVEGGYHANPTEILKLAYDCSNRVVLRNDYMPFEFTVFVSKREAFDKDRVVYPEFTRFL